MRQFLAFAKIHSQNNIAYRTENLIWLVLEILPVLIMTSLWKSLEATGRISPVQSGYLIFYYILTLLISRLAATHFDEWFADEIKDGKISSYLLKPFPVRTYLLASQIVSRLIGTLYTLPVLVFLFTTFVPASRPPVSAASVIMFFSLLAIAFLQRFMFSWLISLSAFWLDQFSALSHLKWILEAVFAGSWLPLTFFPVWWQNIAKLTPFYTWYYFPITLITEVSHPPGYLIWGGVSSLVWLIALFLSGQYLWKKALVRYGAFGG